MRSVNRLCCGHFCGCANFSNPRNTQVSLLGLNTVMNEMEYYIKQHRLSHQNPREFRGRSLLPHVAAIDALLEQHSCDSILDYGCGKAQCWPAEWQGRITGYDPAYEPHSVRPQGRYDMVICTDVMEHVPESAVNWVLQDIFGYADKWVYLSICTRAAGRRLPNGSNKHVTIRPSSWWDLRLQPYDRHTVVYS
jgi:hypothetical protein